jgi:hypothetical protein
VSTEDSTGGTQQYEISLFADLSAFDELERRIVAVVQRLGDLTEENKGLRAQVVRLEEKLARKSEESGDSQRDVERENLLRQRLQDLLKKLEGI